MNTDQKAYKHTNRLINETSPYLLQHAHNPVEWYPWGNEALSKALDENRPILLSIGYSACHWCHVMEKESFENDSIAKLMNEHFVCIKVDREERPDLDEIYMAATTLMNRGQGGWPMTVILTPDQKPFFAGTYFPPTDQYGRPGLASLLAQIADAWQTRRSDLMENAHRLTDMLVENTQATADRPIGKEVIDTVIQRWSELFDAADGGFGEAPKFPPAAAITLLLSYSQHAKHGHALVMALTTLDKMAQGGIYDHIGGGFSRYSVDAHWLVPHFEKMLYDNALLASTYLKAYQVTKNPHYRTVAIGVFEFVLRELTSQEGGFYSSIDADSEGGEGRFYVWDYQEIFQVLSQRDAQIFCSCYDITQEGNWEGKNILHTPRPLTEAAAELNISVEAIEDSLSKSRKTLFLEREKRARPPTDDKCLTSWNALMISAFAEGYRLLNDPRYLHAAENAARFIHSHLRDGNGNLLRTYRNGKAHLNAYLEDYAFLGNSLIDLYEASRNEAYVLEAMEIGKKILNFFWDPQSRTFFNTSYDHEQLYLRYKEGTDGAIPNPNAMSALLLAKLSYYFQQPDLREHAIQAVTGYGKEISLYPHLFASSLIALDFLLSTPVELALVGPSDSANHQTLLDAINDHFIPHHLISFWDPLKSNQTPLPLLEGKLPYSEQTVLYICHHNRCLEPLTDSSSVSRVLAELLQTPLLSTAEPLSLQIAGKATASGTAAFFKKHHLFENGCRPLGDTQLMVSKVGFGCYRIDDEQPVFRQALLTAILSGCNLIDTSTNYTNGRSEQCVGSVLQELISMKKIQRDEVVVVSKIGYVQNQNLHLAKEREAAGHPFLEMTQYSPSCWHCIHPEFLKDQVERSLKRLRLQTIDILLLHNPEYYFLQEMHMGRLSTEEQRKEFYSRIQRAFAFLEELVEAGTIQYYGVSSNTAGLPESDPESTSLSKMLEAALEAAGKSHHFRVLQLPLNLFEASPVYVKKHGSQSVLEYANSHQISVLINRPLNALVEDDILRIADFPVEQKEIDFDEAINQLDQLEVEWQGDLANTLSDEESTHSEGNIFNFSKQFTSLNGQIPSITQWEQIEQQQLIPALSHTFHSLDNYFSTRPQLEDWMHWKGRYLQVLEQVFKEVRRQAMAASQQHSRMIAKKLDPLLPKEYQSYSLSSKALWVASSTPGVTCVLNGMRTPAYVADSMQIMSWPNLKNPESVYIF